MRKYLIILRQLMPVGDFCFGTGQKTSFYCYWLSILILCLFTAPLKAQEYLWHNQIAGTGGSYVSRSDIASDGFGNVYVVGQFAGAIDFGGTSLTSNSIFGDIFFAKYSNGILQWVKKIGLSTCRCRASGATVLTSGTSAYLYITGYVASANGKNIEVNFAPPGIAGLAQFITLTDGEGDSFVAKYGVHSSTLTTPSLFWVKTVPADDNTVGSVAVDNFGNLFLARNDAYSGAILSKYNDGNGFESILTTIGSQVNDIAFNGTNIVVSGKLTPNSKPIAWYNTNGTLLGTTGAADRNFGKIAVDNSTGIYVLGSKPSGAIDNVVIEKYSTSSSTTPIWSKSFNSGINGSFSMDIASGGPTSGEVFVTGWFKGTVNFNNPGNYSTIVTSSGSGTHDNIFVARYFASSGNTDWVKNNTSSTSSGNSNPLAITTHQNKVSVLSLVLNRTVNASFCGSSANVTADLGDDAMIVSYSQKLYAPVISGASNAIPGDPEIYSVTNLPGVNTFAWVVPAGWSILNYGPNNSYINTRVGNNSGYVQSQAIYDCGNSLVTNLFVTVSGLPKLAIAFPNPANQSLTIDINSFSSNASVALLDNGGNILRSSVYNPITSNSESKAIEFDISTIPSGLYFIHISNGNSIVREQIQINH